MLLERPHHDPYRTAELDLGTVPAGCHLLQRRDHLHQTPVDDLPEDGTLVREVVIDRRPAQACLFRDRPDRRPAQAVLLQHRPGSLDDLLPLGAVGSAFLPLGDISLHRQPCRTLSRARHASPNQPSSTLKPIPPTPRSRAGGYPERILTIST